MFPLSCGDLVLFLSHRDLVLFLNYRELLLLSYDDLISPLPNNHPPTLFQNAIAKHHYTSQHTQHDNAAPILLF